MSNMMSSCFSLNIALNKLLLFIMRKTYKGFTLVEMLVVMAIIVLLSAVGFFGGRAIIQNAADTAHKKGASTISTALTAYYNQTLSYPAATGTFATLVDTTLVDYLGGFDGGNDAVYFYMVSDDKNSFLACVYLGGADKSTKEDLYCEGNGFNSLPTTTPATDRLMPYDANSSSAYGIILSCLQANNCIAGTWSGEAKAWK